MKIALINGSPKGWDSASRHLLEILHENLLDAHAFEYTWNRPDSGKKDFEEVIKCDAIVFAFPLYIDTIPSHLLNNLVSFEEYIKNTSLSQIIRVYVIVNNGFFDAKQNHVAIDNIGHWCRRSGVIMAQGVGIGGGGMILGIEKVPSDKGPKKNIGNAMMVLAGNILEERGGEKMLILPNLPAFAYKIVAEMTWRKMAKGNGLTTKDLYRKI